MNHLGEALNSSRCCDYYSPMLFKKQYLDLIACGKLKYAYRKWSRPTVKTGSALLTPVGMLRIKSVEPIEYKDISDKDVRLAGYKDRQELEKELSFKSKGVLYKIDFFLEQEDPRIALRQKKKITSEEFKELVDTLQKLDKSGKIKSWTIKVLRALESEPGRRAIYYATKLQVEKEWLKRNIRKLKNLGLTISLPNGYLISPRGSKFLQLLNQQSK